MARTHKSLVVFMIFAVGLVLASLLASAAEPRRPAMDTPTQNALAILRTRAASMVAALPDNESVTGEQVAASYDNKLVLPRKQMNTVMIVKARAEHAAWVAMDPASSDLIAKHFRRLAGR